MKFNLKEMLTKESSRIDVVEEKYRPSKVKSIIGFVISCIFLIAFFLLLGFQANLEYLCMLLAILLFVFYYGVNVFTEKGYSINKYKNIIVKPESIKEDDEEDEEVDDTKDDDYIDDEDIEENDDENEVQ